MKRRILFVGHSDTRIPPLCAAVMKYLCVNKEINGFEFVSCGFWAMEGQSMSPLMATAAGEIGIDLSDHKAHYIAKEDIDSAMLIIPQDDMVARGLTTVLGKQKYKLYRPIGVQEPSHKVIQLFRTTRDECVAFCEKLLKKLQSIEKAKAKTASAVLYRAVASSEAELVLPLEQACFSHPWTLDNVRSEIEKENAVFMGAFYEEQLVGYASCYIVEETAYMNNVGVHPNYRQLGIGKTLIQSLEGLALDRNASVLTLEVRSKNKPAIAMYEKLGYKNHGTRPFFYRDPIDDAYIMTKVLGDIPEDDGFAPLKK